MMASPGATGTMYQFDFRVIQLRQAKGTTNMSNSAHFRRASDRHRKASPRPTQTIIHGRTRSFMRVTK